MVSNFLCVFGVDRAGRVTSFLDESLSCRIALYAPRFTPVLKVGPPETTQTAKVFMRMGGVTRLPPPGIPPTIFMAALRK